MTTEGGSAARAARPRRAVAQVEDRRLAGILLMMAAFLCFSGVDTSAKWLVTSGLPPLEVVFVRYAGHLAIVSALFLPAQGLDLVRSRAYGVEIVRAILLLGSTVGNFIAIQYLPLTVTASILFTSPLLVCALSAPLLGEKVGWRRWAAILAGFLGVLVIIRPGGAAAHWAVFLSLGSVTCFSFYVIVTRRLAGVDSAATQQFYGALVAALCMAPLALAVWRWPLAPLDWVAFSAIGFFGWIGHHFLTMAHRLAPASALAPFVYSHILFMTASSWLIFHQPPDVWVLVGAAIVVASGLYIWIRERSLGKEQVSTPTRAAPR